MVTVLFATFLLIGGCGGGDDNSATAGNGEITVEAGSLTKAEFVKKADAICKERRAQFDRSYNSLLENAQPTDSPQELEGLIAGVVDSLVIPIYSKQIEEISALGAPAGDEEQVAEFLGALQSRLAVFHDKPTELSRTLTPFKKVENLAIKYGMTGCAESFS